MSRLAHFIALDDFGGLQTLFVAFAGLALERFGHDAPAINRVKADPLPLIRGQLASAGVEVKSVWQSNKRPGSLGRLLNRFSENPRVDLASYLRRRGIERVVGWNYPPTPEMMPLRRGVIVYDHGLSWIRVPSTSQMKKMRAADRFLAVSKASEAMLRQRWLVEQPIDVLPNPLRFTEALRRSPKRLAETLIVGAAGRLVSFKGFASLIAAVGILRSRGVKLRLRIAGQGPEHEALLKQREDLGLRDVVIFEGLVQDMPRFFKELHIFVCPSMREPFGLVSLEALSCGVPTIATNVDGLPETMPFEGAGVLLEPTLSVEDYVALGATTHKMPSCVYHPSGGEVRPPLALDPHVLADSIQRLADSYDLHAEVAAKASQEVRAKHDLSRYAGRLIDLIER